ncbi:27644_t:CDS:1, partial [Racocetra persica]
EDDKYCCMIRSVHRESTFMTSKEPAIDENIVNKYCAINKRDK